MIKMQMIEIENNGPEIIRTNYWQSEYSSRGLFYLSINAGAFRLLVPDSWVQETGEWMTAKEIIISRGPWPEKGKLDALEILFEDYSESPYVVHLASEQIDRLPLDTDRDRKDQPPRWKFSVWTQKGKILEFPCRYRIVKKLPFLKPW